MAALTFQKAEDRLVEVCLIGAVATSIILTAIGLDVKWYIPGIFLALYGIFKTLVDMRETREPGIESVSYPNSSQFYKAAMRRFQEAENSAWVTYTRTIPPCVLDSAEADSYFQYTVDWARRHPDREFRRIVQAVGSEPMAAWLAEHYEVTKEIRNYKVRVVPAYGPVDEIGLAIFDDKVVMLAVSVDGSRMTGHSIQTPAAIAAFREYYIHKWANAESLADYISKIDRVRN
jgi:hypothetical protein